MTAKKTKGIEPTHEKRNGKKAKIPEKPVDTVDLATANKMQQASIAAQRKVNARLDLAADTARKKEQAKIDKERKAAK